MPIKTIHNVETGEIIERELTQEEIKSLELIKLDDEQYKQAKAEAEAQRATAEAKLVALGLTADDLRALGL